MYIPTRCDSVGFRSLLLQVNTASIKGTIGWQMEEVPNMPVPSH